MLPGFRSTGLIHTQLYLHHHELLRCRNFEIATLNSDASHSRAHILQACLVMTLGNSGFLLLFICCISLSQSLIWSLLMSQGDSESVPYLVGSASGPRNELSKSRGLNQSCGDARDPNLTSSSSCAPVGQYRIPDGAEF